MLGADQLIPIIHWTVVHCDISGIYSWLGHISRFLPENWHNHGATGYALSTLDHTIHYLNTRRPKHFGLPSDLEYTSSDDSETFSGSSDDEEATYSDDKI